MINTPWSHLVIVTFFITVPTVYIPKTRFDLERLVSPLLAILVSTSTPASTMPSLVFILIVRSNLSLYFSLSTLLQDSTESNVAITRHWNLIYWEFFHLRLLKLQVDHVYCNYNTDSINKLVTGSISPLCKLLYSNVITLTLHLLFCLVKGEIESFLPSSSFISSLISARSLNPILYFCVRFL